MQNKFYYIKERIKEIAENKGVPIGKFFKELGVSSTGFSGEKLKKGVNSETIQKIISIYPDVDLYWLITGELKKEENHVLSKPSIDYNLQHEIAHLKALLKAKEETIDALKQQRSFNNGSGKAS